MTDAVRLGTDSLGQTDGIEKHTANANRARTTGTQKCRSDFGWRMKTKQQRPTTDHGCVWVFFLVTRRSSRLRWMCCHLTLIQSTITFPFFLKKKEKDKSSYFSASSGVSKTTSIVWNPPAWGDGASSLPLPPLAPLPPPLIFSHLSTVPSGVKSRSSSS